jgi:hypothetical protein
VRDGERVIFDKTKSGSVAAVKQLCSSKMGPVMLEEGFLFIEEVSSQTSKATANDSQGSFGRAVSVMKTHREYQD